MESNFVEYVESVRTQLANVNVAKLGYYEVREFHKVMRMIEGTEKDFPMDDIVNQMIFEAIANDLIKELRMYNLIKE